MSDFIFESVSSESDVPSTFVEDFIRTSDEDSVSSYDETEEDRMYRELVDTLIKDNEELVSLLETSADIYDMYEVKSRVEADIGKLAIIDDIDSSLETYEGFVIEANNFYSIVRSENFSLLSRDEIKEAKRRISNAYETVRYCESIRNALASLQKIQNLT